MLQSLMVWALKVVRSCIKMKVVWTWSFWRVCNWSTWQPWTVGLSWASRCVRCRSSPPNTDRCRNHLCWHTEHGGCTGETRLNIHPYLWRRLEGGLKCFIMRMRMSESFYFRASRGLVTLLQEGMLTLLSHMRSVWRVSVSNLLER